MVNSAIIPFILFQTQWWACILFARYHYPEVGAIIAVLIGILTSWQLKFGTGELKRVSLYAFLGILMDCILSYFKVITYKDSISGVNWLIPTWGLALWLSFAIWLQMATYLQKYKLMFSVLTLFAAPLSYFAGVQLSVMTLGDGYLSLLVIGLCWLIYINLVFFISRTLNF
jgi:hypothetical protein